MDRARVTIPDVAFVLFTVALLGALYPVFSDALAGSAGQLSPGVALLLQLVLPAIVLVMLYSLYQKAIRGAQI
jgi:hypothetical protein